MGKLGWIGAGLGFVLSGPIGAIVGGALGSIIERSGVCARYTILPASTHHTLGSSSVGLIAVQGDFSVSLLVLIAAVMKADGKVLKSET